MIEAWSEEGQCPLVFGLADEDADVPFSGVFLSVVSRSECGSEDSHQSLLTPCQECLVWKTSALQLVSLIAFCKGW